MDRPRARRCLAPRGQEPTMRGAPQAPVVPEPASPGAFAFEELKADLREAHGLSLRALAVRGEVCPRAS